MVKNSFLFKSKVLSPPSKTVQKLSKLLISKIHMQMWNYLFDIRLNTQKIVLTFLKVLNFKITKLHVTKDQPDITNVLNMSKISYRYRPIVFSINIINIGHQYWQYRFWYQVDTVSGTSKPDSILPFETMVPLFQSLKVAKYKRTQMQRRLYEVLMPCRIHD